MMRSAEILFTRVVPAEWRAITIKGGLAVVSFVLFAVLFSPALALVLMWLIAIHEQGHVWAMNRVGLTNKGFYFVPLLGGVAISEPSKTAYDHAFIVIMGPLIGALAALPFLALWLATGQPIWGAYTALIIHFNMINLLPILPLDGGQLAKALIRNYGLKGELHYRLFSLFFMLPFIALHGYLIIAILLYFMFIPSEQKIIKDFHTTPQAIPMTDREWWMMLYSFGGLLALLYVIGLALTQQLGPNIVYHLFSGKIG